MAAATIGIMSAIGRREQERRYLVARENRRPTIPAERNRLPVVAVLNIVNRCHFAASAAMTPPDAPPSGDGVAAQEFQFRDQRIGPTTAQQGACIVAGSDNRSNQHCPRRISAYAGMHQRLCYTRQVQLLLRHLFTPTATRGRLSPKCAVSNKK